MTVKGYELLKSNGDFDDITDYIINVDEPVNRQPKDWCEEFAVCLVCFILIIIVIIISLFIAIFDYNQSYTSDMSYSYTDSFNITISE